MNKNSIFKLTMLFSLLSVFIALAAEELPAPTIAVSPDLYYSLDEILYLEGKAVPNSTVQVQFQRQGSKPLNLNARSDANGEWVLAEKVPLESGNWEVRTRLVKASGNASAWSNPRILKAVVTGVTVGNITVKYVPVVIFLFLAVLASIILLMYSVFRVRVIQRLEQQKEISEKTEFLERSLKEKELQAEEEKAAREKTEKLEKALREKERQLAETALERNFIDLRKSVLEELEHLESRVSFRGGGAY